MSKEERDGVREVAGQKDYRDKLFYIRFISKNIANLDCDPIDLVVLILQLSVHVQGHVPQVFQVAAHLD